MIPVLHEVRSVRYNVQLLRSYVVYQEHLCIVSTFSRYSSPLVSETLHLPPQSVCSRLRSLKVQLEVCVCGGLGGMVLQQPAVWHGGNDLLFNDAR